MADVERLPSPSPLRCLDVFLVLSVGLLFVGLLLVGLLVGLLVSSGPALRHQEEDKIPSSSSSSTSAPLPFPSDKPQNFLYLQAVTSFLRNSTMKWSGGHGGNTLFIFHAKQHSVEVGRTGHYFIYLDLKLNCTSSQCGTGRLEVEVRASEGEPVLTCSVNLHKSPVSQKCWQVFRMDQAGTRLVTRMHVLEGGPGGWALDTAASGQGIFPVGGAS